MKKIPGKKRWYIGGVVILIILFNVLRGLFIEEAGEEFISTKRDLTQETQVVGDVVAHDEALLGFGITGRITEIFFEVGDLVAEGDLLATLDPRSASAEYSLAIANVNREQAELQDLLSGNRQEEIEIEENAFKAQSESLRLAYRNVYQSAFESLSVGENAVRLKTDQLFRDPEGSPALDFSTKRDLRIALERERGKLDDFFESWHEYTDALRIDSFDATLVAQDTLERLGRLSNFMGDLTVAISQSDPSGEEKRAELDQLKQVLSTARSEVVSQQSKFQTVYFTYEQDSANLARQQSELDLVRAGASAGEIATQQARLQAEQARLQQASSSVFDTKIEAPFSGVLTERLYEEGETVSAGTGVLGVATLDTLEIETFIPEVFIGDVTVDDKAFVSLDSYPNRSLDAIVLSVDPKQTDQDGLATYKTTLALEKISDITLRLGMTADITIITSQKNDVVAVPLEYVVFENNKTYLFVREKEGFVQRQVNVGIIDPEGLQEVVEGLAAGDVVKKYE